MIETSQEVDTIWRRTLVRGVLSTRHVFLVAIFNFLNLVNLAMIYRRFHLDQRFHDSLSLFLLVVGFLLVMLGFYMLKVYRFTQQKMGELESEGASVTPLLQLSYLAFRLYLTGLCLSFVALASFLRVTR